MGIAVFNGMLMLIVMAQTFSQRPSDSAVNQHERKQNYRDSFHRSRSISTVGTPAFQEAARESNVKN